MYPVDEMIFFKGSPQWIEIQFGGEDIEIKSFSIQFQGGFVGKDCHLEISKDHKELIKHPFYPEDVNVMQHFKIPTDGVNNKGKIFKLVFNSSTDFFGRIVVYKLILQT